MKLRLCASGVAALSAAILFSTAETAKAQQSASAAAFLEEVVVHSTGTSTEENLEELPLSIQAISADASMQAQGIYTTWSRSVTSCPTWF